MAYRDDRDALILELAEVQRQNEKLRDVLDDAHERYRQLAETRHAERRAEATRRGCALCGGSLLPVAVFAGHDIGSPLPLSMSTLRFGNPRGGFTHAAAIHSMACTSCGFIHNFIDIVGVGDGRLDPSAQPRSSDEVTEEVTMPGDTVVGVPLVGIHMAMATPNDDSSSSPPERPSPVVDDDAGADDVEVPEAALETSDDQP